jgi:imidazole glycerol-phosphate synthase subunit HisH
MIAVIDYGMGNSGSILSILRRIGAEGVLSADTAVIRRADRIVLPGVGAFDEGMTRLHRLGLVPVLEDRVLRGGVPLLGICLGMQLLAEGSEEGSCAGLGWIPGRTIRFSLPEPLRIPHMGWNVLRPRRSHPILDGMEEDARFYFVHSYHLECTDPAAVLATTDYGIEFVSAVVRGSAVGLQCHPEKSLRWGMQVFRRFCDLGCAA